MKTSELRSKKPAELLKQLHDLYNKLRDYRFSASVKKLKNPHLIKATRHDIARILTILIEQNNHEN
ncbi:MAG: 50S ribosomal protein L29 [Patescibacteria group bacterium]